jgi:hypothetical protein
MDTSPIRSEAGSTSSSTSPSIRTLAAERLQRCLAKIAVGNPFYLLSAALLLYGIYRAAVDPRFLETDSKQVIFNFSALQVYEALLAVTAIMLARRRIWYDAGLLVKLDALLVMVPFILISHAIFVGEGLGRLLCFTGGFLAILRLWAFKRGLPNLNLPGPYLVGGLLILLLNAALPLVFRAGLDTDIEAWRDKHLLLWVVVLPALAALPNLFARSYEFAATTLEQRWQPLILHLLWLGGTGVHLVCVNYVDQVNYRNQTALELHLLAPVIWLLAWTLFFRRTELFPAAGLRALDAFLVIPALAPFLAIGHYNTLFFLTLNALNALLYFAVYLRRRESSFLLQLALASFAVAVSATPLGNGWGPFRDFQRADWMAGAMILFSVLEGIVIRTPRFSVAAGILLTVAAARLCVPFNQDPHLAVQIGLIWLLVHSLGWTEQVSPQASKLRYLAALVWIVHSWFWVGDAAGMSAVPWLALATVIAYAGMRLWCWAQLQLVIPLAAVLCVAPIPVNSMTAQVSNTPVGVLALVASFLLFGLGTTFALWRTKLKGASFLRMPEAPGHDG